MGIDFGRTFGAQSKEETTSNSRSDLPKAKIWLNVGYIVPDADVDEATGEKRDRFVSLPMGIPLDTMEKLQTNQSNRDYADFMAARNDLHDQLMEVAAQLEPGDEFIVSGMEGGLALQMRRVSEPRPEVKVDETNRFAINLGFRKAD